MQSGASYHTCLFTVAALKCLKLHTLGYCEAYIKWSIWSVLLPRWMSTELCNIFPILCHSNETAMVLWWEHLACKCKVESMNPARGHRILVAFLMTNKPTNNHYHRVLCLRLHAWLLPLKGLTGFPVRVNTLRTAPESSLITCVTSSSTCSNDRAVLWFSSTLTAFLGRTPLRITCKECQAACL